MIKGFLVQKLKMEQRYDQEGNLVPVTVLKAPPLVVTQLKTVEKDGYLAVQVAGGGRRKANRPLLGHLKKAGLKKSLILREIGLEKEGVKVGEKIKINQVFSPGDLINARGISKGRGFAGVIKRWGFSSQPKTHGQSDRERAPGSIGAQTPGRVFKGKKMPGHYGFHKITVKNLTVLAIDGENNRLLIKGSVPGAIKSWLVIEKLNIKNKKFIPLAKEEKNGKEEEKKEK